MPDDQSLLAALLARCTFPPPGTAITAGVSGGADSLAMLILARAAGCEVKAVHVDHGLRPGSTGEADLVEVVADRFGAAFERVGLVIHHGPDLEARARSARHLILGPDACFGHTLDDRAETVLINLLRGAGTTGLSALRPGHRHPILGLRRSETRAVCAAAELEPFEDPSNADPRFWRNRIRHEVLPLLEDIAGRDLAPVVARQAGLLADDADLIDALATELDVTDARALAAAPVALARAAVRAWLRPTAAGQPPSAAEVERVLTVARGEVVACEVSGGRRVRRSAGVLSLGPPSDL